MRIFRAKNAGLMPKTRPFLGQFYLNSIELHGSDPDQEDQDQVPLRLAAMRAMAISPIYE
jgi:hypothetical protein